MKMSSMTVKAILNLTILMIFLISIFVPNYFCYAAGGTSEYAPPASLVGETATIQDYSLTDEEKAFVSNATPVNIWLEADNTPVMWFDENTGIERGIVVDILDNVTKNTGLKFNYKPILTDKKIPEGDFTFEIKKSEYGINLPVGETYYTNTLFYVDYTLYYEKKMQMSSDEIYRIAIPAHRENVKQYLSAIHPNFKIIEYDNAQKCFDLMHAKKTDLAIINYYTANNLIIKNNLIDIKQVPGSEEEFEFDLKSQSPDAKLITSIINKGMGKMENGAVDNIILNYATAVVPDMSFRYFATSSPGLVLVGIVILFVLVFLLAYFWANSRYEKTQNILLDKANVELRVANEAKMDFLSRMSHDIRTPMNVIIGMTRIALKEKSSEKKDDYLKKIDMSSEFLLGLVNDILDMNRLESGQVVLHEEPYSYMEFLQYINDFLKPLYEEKNMEFSVNIKGTPIQWLYLDKLRFNQIFFNLLSNAVKYTPERGKIELIIEEPVLDGEYVILDCIVKDNGIGISEKFQEKLFEPFSRENTELTNLTQGTGLGLSIVKNLVDMMGGSISVKSKENEGTEFRIHFRARIAEAPDEKASVVNEGKGSLKGGHVLLCEDHALNREIMNRILESEEIIVSNAENGLQAVEAFMRAPVGYFDAILMDIRMPVMDGLTATREIRNLQRPDAKDVTIIALTANAYYFDVQEALDAGMNAHLEKPVDLDELHQMLYKAFSEKNTNKGAVAK